MGRWTMMVVSSVGFEDVPRVGSVASGAATVTALTAMGAKLELTEESVS